MIQADFNYTEKERIGTIKFFGEKKFNIMSEQCVKKLFKKVCEASKKDGPKAVIVSGNEESFMVGLDIDIFKTFTNEEIGRFARLCCGLMDEFEASPVIFISAVNGYCLGGGLELAMATDYIIASKDAKFGLPEIKLGLIPGADGIKRLVRAVGMRKAFELVISGRTLSAKEALEIGLVNEVVRQGKLMQRSEELAQEISMKNPVAVSAIKRLSHMALYKDIKNDEIKAFQKCLQTEYAEKAISAFLNRKR